MIMPFSNYLHRHQCACLSTIRGISLKVIALIEKAYVHPESDAHIHMQIFRTNISSLKLPVGYLSALMSAVPPDLPLHDLRIFKASRPSPSQSPLLMTSLRIVQLRLPYSTYNTYPAIGYVFQLAAGKVLFTYIHSAGLPPPPALCGR